MTVFERGIRAFVPRLPRGFAALPGALPGSLVAVRNREFPKTALVLPVLAPNYLRRERRALHRAKGGVIRYENGRVFTACLP
jgi:hypothetical protein